MGNRLQASNQSPRPTQPGHPSVGKLGRQQAHDAVEYEYGDRSFSVAGPCLWNSLPVTLRDRDISLVQFKRLLKTLLFV